MPEIGTSGSMSGDGKRGVAERPKLPRPSSTLPKLTSRMHQWMSAFGGKADIRVAARQPLSSDVSQSATCKRV